MPATNKPLLLCLPLLVLASQDLAANGILRNGNSAEAAATGGMGNGVDYGFTKHRSKFVAVRGSLGLAAEISPGIHFGTSFGVIYSENTLQAPYIFQTQPMLQGLKTRLDMKTDGIGYNATFGLLLEPHSDLTIGLRYTTETNIKNAGAARGNAALATGGTVGDYRFDADVETSLPAVASIGAEWQTTSAWQLRGQLDWINWSDAFDTLPVRLTNGSNAGLPRALTDHIPLNWEDRFVARLGINYQWSDRTALRVGYSYSKSPVPSATLTPLNGAIMEHTVGLGLGHRIGNYQIDLAYQWDLPAEQRVGNSALRAGEYSNSELEVGIHWLILSVSLGDAF